jgi:hypothetical protein
MDSRREAADSPNRNRPRRNDHSDDSEDDKDSEMELGDGSFVPIAMSSDTSDEEQPDDQDGTGKYGKSKKGKARKGDDLAGDFDRFVKRKQTSVPSWDEAKIDLLPADLRPAIRTIATKIKRWASRNPTGLARREMDILIQQLNTFLELQTNRNDPSYERQCQVWLFDLYGRTIDAQKAAIALRNEAVPKSLDEYMDTPPFRLPRHHI